MLKGVHALLTADLLYILRAMGHGDELVVADANFPATTISKSTTFGEVVSLNGSGVVEAIRAVLSILPLDTFVTVPVWRMQVVNDSDYLPPVQLDVQALVDAAMERSCPMAGLARHEFYERAGGAFAVVATGELRAYGDFILKKGVINCVEAGYG